jgi:hypothetical protein
MSANYFIGSKTQISPCIVAKARFALKLTKKKPKNTKACSYKYWCAVITTLSAQHNLPNQTIEDAKSKFKSLIK